MFHDGEILSNIADAEHQTSFPLLFPLIRVNYAIIPIRIELWSFQRRLYHLVVGFVNCFGNHEEVTVARLRLGVDSSGGGRAKYFSTTTSALLANCSKINDPAPAVHPASQRRSLEG
jgi:hypothetical protein